LRGLSTALTVLYAFVTVGAVMALVAFFHRASVADDFLDNNASLQDIVDADRGVRTGAGLWALAMLAAFVVLVVWQFRHAKNAESLRGPLRLGPGWAIGGWFIPAANLVLPAVQIGQAAKASDPMLRPGETRSRGRLPAVVVLWAGALGLAVLLFFSGLGQRPSDTDAFIGRNQYFTDYAQADRTAGAAMVMYAVAAVAALVMVRQLTDRQHRAIEVAPATYPAPPPPPPPGSAIS
jgi:hypothetical protein